MKLVIFAGGSGTRLWPVSRKHIPKQAQPFGDRETLLQKTYARLRRGFRTQDIWLATGADQARLLRRQLPAMPKDQIIIEPARRDTSAAIGLAATILHAKFPREIMATVWADSYIKDPDHYIQSVKRAGRVIRQYPDRTVLIGLKPRYADTGLGYLQLKRKITSVGGMPVYRLDRFVEKPDQKTADRFVRSWKYLWNPGMFMFRLDAMLHKYERWMPDSAEKLRQIATALNTPREMATLRRIYPTMEKKAIEFAIMEKDSQLLAIPGTFIWSDVGTWAAVHEMLARHPRHNVTKGRHVSIDSAGNLLFSFSDKVIATAGLHDMVVIETDDAILVCPRNRTQDVRAIVQEMEKQHLHAHL